MSEQWRITFMLKDFDEIRERHVEASSQMEAIEAARRAYPWEAEHASSIYAFPQDESDWQAPNWEITIEHNGMWPHKWTWRVAYSCYRDMEFHRRRGDARTKEKAQQKAAAARVSIERDDLLIRDIEGEAIR